MRFTRLVAVGIALLVLVGGVLGTACSGGVGEQGAKGDSGADGVGVENVVNNGDGTFTVNLTNGEKYSTDNLTGPQGVQGIRGEKGDPFMVVSKPDVAANDRFVDGIWRVGLDIEPGLYWTPGPEGYWARLSGFGGTTSDIIANGNNDGPTYVQITATDVGFESSGCSYWIRIED